MESRIKILLEDLTFNAEYEFLEEGKHADELSEIAAKRGIKLPSKDLSIFKCRYAMVDKQNRNKCTLPRKEVKKALRTLIGKAIDKDHFRQNTVGFWLDDDLIDEEIIAYGAFWKSNFPDDYEEIKKRMLAGKLKISFEAWGDRIFKEGKSYDLTNIEFAGGALLFDSEPAFPNAEVMEFSQYKDKILEFAKIIETEEIDNTLMEESKLSFNWDKDNIARMMMEAECPLCKSKGWFDISSIDFDNNIIKGKCGGCGSIANVDLTPSVTIIKKGKKPQEKASVITLEDIFKELEKSEVESNMEMLESFDCSEEELEMAFALRIEGEDFIDDEGNKIEDAKKLTYKERKNVNDDMFAVVVTVKNKITGEPRKIRMFPIQDPAHVRNALARLPQATQTLKKLGVSPETVKNKILKRARELKMTDLLKRHIKGGVEVDELLKKYDKASIDDFTKFIDEMAASLTAKDSEMVSLKKEIDESKLLIENSKIELEKIKVEAKAIRDELDKRINAEKAAFIKTRKDELGDWVKDLSDEDILNDLKFENAKLKKELDAAKRGQTEVNTAGLEAGAEVTERNTTVFTKQSSIQKRAFEEIKDK